MSTYFASVASVIALTLVDSDRVRRAPERLPEDAADNSSRAQVRATLEHLARGRRSATVTWPVSSTAKLPHGPEGCGATAG